MIFFLVYKISKKYWKSEKVRKYAKRQLVDRYSFFQRALLGCTLEICISAFIEIVMHQTVTPLEKASYFLSVSFLIILFFYCRHIMLVFNRDYFKMKNDDLYPVFNNKWSVIWEGMKGESNQITPYNLFFIIRRVLFAAIIVIIPVYTNLNPFSQYYMVVMLNLYSCAYTTHYMPFESRSMNLTELFNEWVNLTVSSWFLIAMITIEEDDQGKLYNIGLMTNYLVLGMISINFLFVFSNMYKDARLNMLRKKNLKLEKDKYVMLWNKANKKVQKVKNNGKHD